MGNAIDSNISVPLGMESDSPVRQYLSVYARPTNMHFFTAQMATQMSNNYLTRDADLVEKLVADACAVASARAAEGRKQASVWVPSVDHTGIPLNVDFLKRTVAGKLRQRNFYVEAVPGDARCLVLRWP